MKHLLLLPAMLLVSAISVAQLYVAPNDNGTPGNTTDDVDSFVYVNDQILFVEQDVNLSENTNDAELTASIYLRNDGQLIQGASNSLNAGSGYISVYRENPGSDAYDYTFYGSPVGDNFTTPLAAPGNINFGIMSIHTPTYDPTALDYTAPLSLTEGIQTSTTSSREGDFVTATNTLEISTRWTYTKGGGHGSPWVRMYANNVAPAAQGFIMKGVNRNGGSSSHDFVYDFRGRPNNGTFNITVPALAGPHPQSITPLNPTGTVYQEILSGNPYPSILDLNRLFYDTGETDIVAKLTNSEITGFLFWDEDRSRDNHLYTENKGGFGVWTPGASDPNGTNMGNYTVAPFLSYDSSGNPTGTQTGSGGMQNRRFAPIGQGFYFRTDEPMVGDATPFQLVVRNQQRRFIKESTGDAVFRNTEPSALSDFTGADPGPGTGSNTANMDPQFRIYTYFDESHFRDMLLIFNDTTTDLYDWGWDGFHQMDAVGGDAYFPIQVTTVPDPTMSEFVIQALPFDLEKKVPYAIVLSQQTQVIVQAVEEINTTSEAYLWDSQENTYQKISGNSTASLILPAGEYKERFFITFLDQAGFDANPDERAATRETVTGNVDFFQNNTLGQLEVMNPEGYEIEYAHIFDMSGKLVQTRTDMGTDTSFTMNTASFADGVYLVKLVTNHNISIDYKAIVFNK
ncbi:T9SS type A sorting domain-containing protein [Rasiella rasia]|uniref:T9SS type A sorting domain-containing protein n=1 Tax=Rasiella rasia TaxID=2744027 RepID=A0A6G6GIF3_9FLAO|nr:T9SS type A sorting domain-containing protein [Rasiella rasia]QIE58328.1 T9SS type A sorting domain-containing protein [Rasiella rasia]